MWMCKDLIKKLSMFGLKLKASLQRKQHGQAHPNNQRRSEMHGLAHLTSERTNEVHGPAHLRKRTRDQQHGPLNLRGKKTNHTLVGLTSQWRKKRSLTLDGQTNL